MDGALRRQVASHLLGILISTLLSVNLYADSDPKIQKTEFNRAFFRPGSYAVVHLKDVPAGEEALIHKVEVRWQDREEKTEGQLYIDDFSYLWPERVSPEWSTKSWEMIDFTGHGVQLQILDISEFKDAMGARIESITVHYTYPIPPEDPSEHTSLVE